MYNEDNDDEKTVNHCMFCGREIPAGEEMCDDCFMNMMNEMAKLNNNFNNMW